MVLGAEIVLVVMGIYALVTGKLTLSKKRKLRGNPARIAGLIMISPIILALGFGFLIGILIGLGILPTDASILPTIIEIALIVGALIAVYFYGKAHAVTEPEQGDIAATSGQGVVEEIL
jgi:hypothetical protein